MPLGGLVRFLFPKCGVGCFAEDADRPKSAELSDVFVFERVSAGCLGIVRPEISEVSASAFSMHIKSLGALFRMMAE